MLWTAAKSYENEPFDVEEDLEKAVQEVWLPLFGDRRIYVNTKRKIGKRGGTRNIPDGYLIDLSSKKEPRLYVVENELVKHDPLKHIAVQILQFSLSFETSPHKVKSIVREELTRHLKALSQCQKYAEDNGFENIDVLLERIIYPKDAFNALVIIDEMPDELETVLQSRFRFPVEIVTLERYCTRRGERVYRFEPFMVDISGPTAVSSGGPTRPSLSIDPSEIDTIVVPAREDGFQETFLGEDCWYSIRIHGSMIPKIKHIAAYRVAPESAITHIAEVRSIEQWKDTNKYILNFVRSAEKIGPIKLVQKGRVKPLYSSRYTSREKLENAKTLDDVF